MEAFQFNCSICGEGSTRICVFCTKDTCSNHICDRCRRCSDCCECETPRDEAPNHEPVHSVRVEPEEELATVNSSWDPSEPV